MSILNIRKAERAGSKVVIGIAGISGSGKTYTALKIARGMVDHPGEIGFLDTENRRGSLYADILDAPFLIGDLYAPFSPERYSQAIKEFQDAGVNVLVIDSISHEWEGDGGCIDIANAPLLRGKKMADWKNAKSEHKKFMRTLLQSDMHVICCIRAAEKTDFSNPREPKSLGIQPTCEKNFMFEMTTSMMMYSEGSQQQFLKVPEALRQAFGNGQSYIGESTGQQIIQWVNSGAQINHELESWKNKMQLATENGVDHLKDEWRKMPNDILKLMKDLFPSYEASAQAFDVAMVSDSVADTPAQSFTPVQKPADQTVSQSAGSDIQQNTQAQSIDEF